MHVCVFCQHTGKKGALYLLAVKGHQTQRVHRPCGEKLLSALPEQVEAKLEPSSELRLQWRQERQQKEDATRVQTFWAEKLQGLKLPEASQLPYLIHDMVSWINGGGKAMQIVISNGIVVGAVSFTTGFVPHKRTTRRLSEDDVMATALWLDCHGRREEGETLLDRWCKGFALYFR